MTFSDLHSSRDRAIYRHSDARSAQPDYGRRSDPRDDAASMAADLRHRLHALGLQRQALERLDADRRSGDEHRADAASARSVVRARSRRRR